MGEGAEEKVYALYLAYKDARVPLYAHVFAAIVVGYAFGPVDPIPILGTWTTRCSSPSGWRSRYA